MMKLNRNDVSLLTDASKRGSLGIYSHIYFAAARKRMIEAGYIFESNAKIYLGQYRSELRITIEGRAALVAHAGQGAKA